MTADGSPVDLDDAVDVALVGARRVAVVGASPAPDRPGHALVRALLEAGHAVVPVTRGHDEVLGLPTAPDLAAVPGRIDVVAVVDAAEDLVEVARAAVAREDVAVVWNQEGLVADEARAVVRAAGRGYVEDRCLRTTITTIAARGAGPPKGPRLEHPVVLLDLDDTVLDHVACERAAVTATLRAFDLDASDVAIETYARHNAALWARYRDGGITPERLRSERWEATLAELGVRTDTAAVAERYLEEFATTGVLVPGAAAAVWWLARRSRVAVVTNGFRRVQEQRLAATGLDGLVELLVSSEEAGVAKPDPAPLRLALARLGVEPAPGDVAVVGDQLATDVAGGHALGAHTVWIAPDDAVVPADATGPHVRVARLADVA